MTILTNKQIEKISQYHGGMTSDTYKFISTLIAKKQPPLNVVNGAINELEEFPKIKKLVEFYKQRAF